MATRIFSGDAIAIAQVNSLVVFGTIEVGDLFRMTINGKNVDVVAASTDAATVAVQIAAAWNASTIPEFAEVTCEVTGEFGRMTLTADTPGKPFTVTVDSFEDVYGGAYDDQDFTVAAAVANDGPNVWSANNFKTDGVRGTIPAGSDIVIFRDSDVDMKYNLDQSGVASDLTLQFEASYTGEVGLPATNEDGDTDYNEYRTRALVIDADVIEIGKGEGAGSAKIRLRRNDEVTTFTVFSTGSSSDDQKTVEYTQNGPGIAVANIFGGSIEFNDSEGNGSIIALNVEGDSDVSLIGVFSGNNTTFNVNGAAILTLPADFASNPLVTINIRGGTINSKAADDITNLNIFSGAFNLSPTGAPTITNLIMGPGSVFNTADAVGTVTITNTTLQGGLSGTATINDPSAKTVWSNDIDIGPAKQSDFILDFGPGRDVGISGP
jgi:hypothetical protein